MLIFVTTNFASLLNLVIKIKQGTGKGRLQKTQSEEGKKKHISIVKHILSPAVFPSVVLKCDSTRLPMFGEKRKVKDSLQKIPIVLGEKYARRRLRRRLHKIIQRLI